MSVEMIKINSKSKKPNYFFFFSFLKVKTESNINKIMCEKIMVDYILCSALI